MQTNIDWIGEIPVNWELKRGKYLFKFKKEINKNLQSKNLLSLTLNGVLNKDFQSSEGLRPESYRTYQIFEKDDLVFKMIDLENIKTSRVGIVHEKGIMSPVYIRHEPCRNKIIPRFAFWIYFDLYKKNIYNNIGSGVRSSLTSSDLLDIKLPLPPLNEQNFIVEYLDKKTQQIDSLIEKIEKKIELLKEQKTTLINQFLTKGLDKNVEMKDSGFEYIGKIPKHWNYLPLKYLTLSEDGIKTGPFGTQLNSKDYQENGVKVLSQKTLINEDYSLGEEYISHEKFLALENFALKSGDIIMGTRGSFGTKNRTTFGKCSIVPKSDEIFVLHPCLIRIRLIEKKILKDYFLIFINLSSIFLEQIKKISKSTTIEVIYGVDLKEIKLPLPPIKEQFEILKELNTKIKNLDNYNRKYIQKISLLKEYRQSLISSVVTGKKRVV